MEVVREMKTRTWARALQTIDPLGTWVVAELLFRLQLLRLSHGTTSWVLRMHEDDIKKDIKRRAMTYIM